MIKTFPASREAVFLNKMDLDNVIQIVSNSTYKSRAVFLDRDGVLNHDKGYLHDPKSVRLLSLAGAAIRLLNCVDVRVIVITNQSAIGRGIMSTTDLEMVNRGIWRRLRKLGAYYDALYYCPHDPTTLPNCLCRKPKPGLLYQAALDFELSLERSFMIGDKPTDVMAGEAAGCKTILIRGERLRGCRPDFIAPNLYQSIPIILGNLKHDD